jgi:hypothetical protein
VRGYGMTVGCESSRQDREGFFINPSRNVLP